MRRHARVSSVSARSILRLISLGVSVFALASCAVGDGASEGERIGRTQQAVGNGEDIAPDGTGGGVATWLEIYVLAGQGEGRRAIQVNNELDPCCFAGGIADSYATLVSERVHALGAGEWSNVIDVGATTHEISEHILESILAPALVPPIVTSDARRPPTVGP